MSRLSNGGRIDRGRQISFKFDGETYKGYEGDTLASALLANGVKLVGRSFKYHRPRGVLTAGPEEPNALVELRTGARKEPNTRATVVELLLSSKTAESKSRRTPVKAVASASSAMPREASPTRSEAARLQCARAR